MTTHQYKIDLILRLTAPMMFASPEEGWVVDRATGRIYRGSAHEDKMSTNLKRTLRLGLAQVTGAMAGLSEMPVIPVNSLRGAFRHHGSNLLFEAMLRNGQRCSENTHTKIYHAARCGAATAEPDLTGNVIEMARVRKDPWFGTFGGTARLIESGYMIENGFPVHEKLVDLRAMDRELLERLEITPLHGDFRNLTEPVFMVRKDPMIQGHDPMIDRLFTRGDEVIQRHVGELGTARQQRSDQEKEAPYSSAGKKVGLQHLVSHETILTGQSYYTTLLSRTHLTGLAGLGILLLTLERFAGHQQIGSMINKGYGRFKSHAFLTLEDGAKVSLFLPGTYDLDQNIPLVAAAINAWLDHAATITLVDLMKIADPVSDKPKSDTAKKKENAARPVVNTSDT